VRKAQITIKMERFGEQRSEPSEQNLRRNQRMESGSKEKKKMTESVGLFGKI